MPAAYPGGKRTDFQNAGVQSFSKNLEATSQL